MRTDPSDAKRRAKAKPPLPEAGRKKKDPKDLDKLLDKGVEDSMVASDVPAVTQPEVHTEADRDAEDVEKGDRTPKTTQRRPT